MVSLAATTTPPSISTGKRPKTTTIPDHSDVDVQTPKRRGTRPTREDQKQRKAAVLASHSEAHDGESVNDEGDSHDERRGNSDENEYQQDHGAQEASEQQNTLAIIRGSNIVCHMNKNEIVIGRSSKGNHVDVNLSHAGATNKLSRKQAIISVANGEFSIKNIGRRLLYLNKQPVEREAQVQLPLDSEIEICGFKLLFGKP